MSEESTGIGGLENPGDQVADKCAFSWGKIRGFEIVKVQAAAAARARSAKRQLPSPRQQFLVQE